MGRGVRRLSGFKDLRRVRGRLLAFGIQSILLVGIMYNLPE
jgi:hypothetical protein